MIGANVYMHKASPKFGALEPNLGASEPNLGASAPNLGEAVSGIISLWKYTLLKTL